MDDYCPDVEPKREVELDLLKFLMISAHKPGAQLDEWGELINKEKKIKHN